MATQTERSFDPAGWLKAFVEIGGGYCLTSTHKLCFVVENCDAEDLTGCMAQLMGRPDRQEAIRRAIEARQLGEVS